MADILVFTSDHELLAHTVTVVTYHPNGLAVWSGYHRQYIVGQPTAIRIPDTDPSAWSVSLFEQYFMQDVPMAIYLNKSRIIGEADFVKWVHSLKGEN